MIDKESLKEFEIVVQNAASGNWIPLTIVAVLLGVVITLLMVIYNIQQKTSDKRHQVSEEAISEISKNNVLLDKIVTAHEERLNAHGRELDRLNKAG